MEFSRQYLTRLSQESNFIKDALEKVLSVVKNFLFKIRAKTNTPLP